MREYLQNLTTNLMGKNHYHELYRKIGQDQKKFIAHVKNDLLCGDVRAMSDETLGKIMGSLDYWREVGVRKEELFSNLEIEDHHGSLLHELVALCLAHTINKRLSNGFEMQIWATKKALKEGRIVI